MPNVNLIAVRGDTLQVEIANFRTSEGETYTLSDTDVVYLDVRKQPSSKVLIHKELTSADYNDSGNLTFTFTPAETESIEPGEYFYDARLVQDSYNIYTVVPMSKLLIVRGITEIPRGVS
jgi:hypothetical protein